MVKSARRLVPCSRFTHTVCKIFDLLQRWINESAASKQLTKLHGGKVSLGDDRLLLGPLCESVLFSVSVSEMQRLVAADDLDSKSMFTMCNADLNACWNNATARRHWTEQWRHDQVRRRSLPNRTEFINFSESNLINDNTSFCSRIFLAIDLQCHVFPFEKLLLNIRFCL